MRGVLVLSALLTSVPLLAVPGFAAPASTAPISAPQPTPSAASMDNELVLPKVAFRATAVQKIGAYENRETIFYADGKLRIERGRGFSTTILDLATQTECILMVNRSYLVRPIDAGLYRRFFAPNPALLDEPKLGAARIDGILTTRYRFNDSAGLKAAGIFWLSPDGIMLRRDYQDGLFGENIHHLESLQDIAVGKQPVSLFMIPKGYRLVH